MGLLKNFKNGFCSGFEKPEGHDEKLKELQEKNRKDFQKARDKKGLNEFSDLSIQAEILAIIAKKNEDKTLGRGLAKRIIDGTFAGVDEIKRLFEAGYRLGFDNPENHDERLAELIQETEDKLQKIWDGLNSGDPESTMKDEHRVQYYHQHQDSAKQTLAETCAKEKLGRGEIEKIIDGIRGALRTVFSSFDDSQKNSKIQSDESNNFL